jgi:hypothetical protein
MQERIAHMVTLSRQQDMRYLVACGCPHQRPADAPFFACMSGAHIKHPVTGANGFIQLAKCRHLEGSKDADDGYNVGNGDRVVLCSFHKTKLLEPAEPIGRFGIPEITIGDRVGAIHAQQA